MKQNPYVLLASYVLPQELSNYFEVVDVAEEKVDDELWRSSIVPWLKSP